MARAASHLTVNPGMAVLTKSACAPMLLQNCYLVACRRGELRVLTLGFTGAPADVKSGEMEELFFDLIQKAEAAQVETALDG